MYTKFLLTILTLLSFMTVAYSQLSQPKTIEPFAGLHYPFAAKRQTMVSDGAGCTDIHTTPGNLQQYGGHMAVLPKGGSSQGQDDNFKQVANNVTQSFYGSGGNAEQFVPQAQNTMNGLHNPGVPQEGYVGPDNFFTVPGTKDSNIAPRFMNTDFGANITYNFPAQEHMAAEPDNPLTLANNVENFEQQEQENYENVQTKFAEVHEAVPLPPTMDGPVRENYEQGSSVPTNPVVYDRMIITTGSGSRNDNACDHIRGDLPIVPECRGWFQSRHAHVENLCTGALAQLGDVQQDAMKKLILSSTGDTVVGGASVTNDIARKVGQKYNSNVVAPVGYS